MYLPVSLMPENNILRISWQQQPGVSQYTIEKWAVEGTNYWIYEINKKFGANDKQLKIGGKILEPSVIKHTANQGKMVEYYDENVKSGYTYFYRVNSGVIGAGETKKREVRLLSNEQKGQIAQQQALEGENLRGMRGISDSQNERQKQYEEVTDYPERLAADLIMALPNWLVEVVGLYDPLELVFEVDLIDSYKLEQFEGIDSELTWNTFSQDEFRVIGEFYDNTTKALPVFMAVGVVMAGLLLLFRSTGSSALNIAKGFMLGILISALLIKVAPYLLSFFFDINKAIIALCHSIVAEDIKQSFLHTIYNKETRSIGAALMALIGCISIGIINFQFAVRKLFIAILVGILPIALINSIFPGRRNVLMIWVKEFSSYVFMPAGLAVGLSFFIQFLNNGNFWITLVCLLSLPTISNLVRGTLGLGDSSIPASIGSALGMGAVFSVGNILSGGGSGNIVTSDNGSSLTMPGAGNISTGNKGDYSYLRTVRDGNSLKPGEMFGRDGYGVGGTLTKAAINTTVGGSMAFTGSMLSGAMVGEPVAGLEAGTKIGNALSKNLNESASNVRTFIAEVKEKGFDRSTGIVDNSMLMDPGVAASLATKILGDNSLGETAALAASSASMGFRAVAPILAPQAKERLDQVSSQIKNAEDGQKVHLSKEFRKVRLNQNYREIFENLQKKQYTGSLGGLNDSDWR